MEIPANLKKRRYYQIWRKELSKHFWIVKKGFWLRGLLLLSTFIAGIASALVIVTLFTIGFYGLAYFYTGNLRDDQGKPLNFDKIKRGDFKRSSSIYDYSGKEVIGRFFYEIRDPVSKADVPPLLAQGFIAAEDQRFYWKLHRGVDWLAVGRAFVFNTLHQIGWKYGPKSGASSIPQQVARLIYAEELSSFHNREPTIRRKSLEAQVAIQLVKRYSKDVLLATFLNQIYFGHGVNGIAEARRYYFGKGLKDGNLDLREVAILASLNKSPSIYCPIFHRPSPCGDKVKDETALTHEQIRIISARGRYNWVLERMLDEGYISPEQYKAATFKENEPSDLSLVRQVTKLNDPRFGYGNRMVKEMLLEQGFTDNEISQWRGLMIKTGFDWEIQGIVTEEVNNQLAIVNKELAGQADKLEGSFVMIENQTGRIAAFSGGHDFSETPYNRALALRSPGSAFKPIVFAAAFEFAGKTFEDLICNCPFSMRGANNKRWTPQNFPEDNPVPLGYRPLPEILIRSVNLGTLNLARGIGIKPIVKTGHLLGVWGEKSIFRDSAGEIWFKAWGAREKGGGLEPLLPTAIGASDVSLLELTNAYAVFQRDGIYLRPQMILEIRDTDNQVLFQAEKQTGRRVLSKETAHKITILLRAVTKVGTAKISMRNIEQQVAVKTGTSNGPNDLSMIGFTPEFTLGIRFGYDQPHAIDLPVYMKRVSGANGMPVSGGWVVGPVFRRIIDRLYQHRAKVKFTPEIEEGLAQLLNNYQGRK